MSANAMPRFLPVLPDDLCYRHPKTTNKRQPCN